MHSAVTCAFELYEQVKNSKMNLRKRLQEFEEKEYSNEELEKLCSIPTGKKTIEDILTILAGMKIFKSFVEQRQGLDDQDLLILGLSIKYKVFQTLQPLCKIHEIPNEVYYVLGGKIAVTNKNEEIFKLEQLEISKVFHYEQKGIVLGEESILYNSTR